MTNFRFLELLFTAAGQAPLPPGVSAVPLFCWNLMAFKTPVTTLATANGSTVLRSLDIWDVAFTRE